MLLLKTENGELLAELDKQRTSLGRDPANEVVLTDPSVSGFHAVILNDRGTVSVIDVGSTNGTSLGGARLAGRTELSPWTTLQLGGVRLKIEDSEGRAPTVVQAAVGRGRGAAAAKTSLRPAARSGDATRVTPAAGPGGATRVTPAAPGGDATRVTPAAPGGGAGSSSARPGGERTEVLPAQEGGGGSGTVASPAASSAGGDWADRPVQSSPPRSGIRFEPLQPQANRPGSGAPASPGAGVPPAAGGVGAGVPGAGVAPPSVGPPGVGPGAPGAGAAAPASAEGGYGYGAAGAGSAAGMPWAAASNDYARSGGYPRGLKWLLFSFKGRINRKTWWLTILAGFVGGVVLNGIALLIAAAFAGGTGLLAALDESPAAAAGALVATLGVSALLFLPLMVGSWWVSLAAMAKRLHDSGGRSLFWTIYVIGLQILYFFAALSQSVAPEAIQILLALVWFTSLLPGFYLLYLVGFRKGDEGSNGYGDPNPAATVVAFRW